jgi:hypothetical protein
MCRLAFIPGKAKINYQELLDLFNALEASCGGDGNGYVAVSPEGASVLNKAVKLTNAQIVKETYKLIRSGWAVYYHTRKISVGWSDDAQCHPFKISGRKFKGYMCHNGTWIDGSVMAKYFNVGSDTAAFAKLIGEFGLKALQERKLFPHSGIFLLYGSHPKGQSLHRVLNIAGDLEYCPKSGIWASEFHAEYKYWNDTYRVMTGRHMLEKPAPRKLIQLPMQTQPRNATKPRYASDIESSWFRRAYGPPDYIEELDGTDHNITRNLLDT